MRGVNITTSASYVLCGFHCSYHCFPLQVNIHVAVIAHIVFASIYDTPTLVRTTFMTSSSNCYFASPLYYNDNNDDNNDDSDDSDSDGNVAHSCCGSAAAGAFCVFFCAGYGAHLLAPQGGDRAWRLEGLLASAWGHLRGANHFMQRGPVPGCRVAASKWGHLLVGVFTGNSSKAGAHRRDPQHAAAHPGAAAPAMVAQ